LKGFLSRAGGVPPRSFICTARQRKNPPIRRSGGASFPWADCPTRRKLGFLGHRNLEQVIAEKILDPARPPDRSRFQCRQVGGGGRVDHSNGSKRRSTSVASSAAAALPPLRGYPRPALRALPSFRERLYAPREPLRVLSVPRSITATARQCATVLGACSRMATAPKILLDSCCLDPRLIIQPAKSACTTLTKNVCGRRH
jgi:hypothetical protein